MDARVPGKDANFFFLQSVERRSKIFPIISIVSEEMKLADLLCKNHMSKDGFIDFVSRNFI